MPSGVLPTSRSSSARPAAAPTPRHACCRAINAALRDEFGKRTVQEVVSGERTEIMATLARNANEQAADLGVEIVDVRIKADRLLGRHQ